MIAKTKRLNDGNEIPTLGLGTWRAPQNVVGQAVEYAITKAGYRHIDCAMIYSNEKEVGQALEKSFKVVKREEVFITGKLWNTDHRPEDVEKAVKSTLSDLKLDYLDLYLMHWGIAFPPGEDSEPLDKDGKVLLDKVSIAQTWQAMEELVKKGLVKSIGVANFTTMMIIDLLLASKIPPAMNQIELHPYNAQDELVDFCLKNNIAVTGYSPLGRHGVAKNGGEALDIFDEKLIKELSKKYGKSEAQILLNWAIIRGTIPIPKSVTPERIEENINVFDFDLSKGDIKKISDLNRNYRFVEPKDWWQIPYFS